MVLRTDLPLTSYSYNYPLKDHKKARTTLDKELSCPLKLGHQVSFPAPVILLAVEWFDCKTSRYDGAISGRYFDQASWVSIAQKAFVMCYLAENKLKSFPRNCQKAPRRTSYLN
jgi:hypothetical protein